MANVTIEDPTRMNILGLILGSILERNIADPKRAALLGKLDGDVVVKSGAMAITVGFGGGTARIQRGAVDRPKAKLEGRIDVLTELTLGRGVVKHFFGGRIKLKGNIFLLLRTWRLLLVSAPTRPQLEAGS